MPKEINLPEGLTADEAADVLHEYSGTEQATIINQSEFDSLQSQVDEIKKVFSSLLAEESPQSQETLARQDLDALTEPFKDDEGDVEIDTLNQTLETGDVKNKDTNPDDDDGSVDTLTLHEKEELQRLDSKRTTFRNRGIESRAEDIEAEMCDIASVDDVDTLEREVL